MTPQPNLTHPTLTAKAQTLLETPAGQRITLEDSPAAVLIQDTHGNTIRLDASGITIVSASAVTINAASITVNASSLSVNAAQSTFSGVVKAETLIATSVVAATYTPGAGNVW